MKKTLFLILIVAVVVGGGAFYGGMKYAQSKVSQGRAQGFSGAGVRNGGLGNGSSGGFATGEIISKDEKSVTIKLREGGSKIIFYSDTTEIDKSVTGNSEDLEIGKTVTISGKTNQDGSITAQSIQLRPAVMPNQ